MPPRENGSGRVRSKAQPQNIWWLAAIEGTFWAKAAGCFKACARCGGGAEPVISIWPAAFMGLGSGIAARSTTPGSGKSGPPRDCA
jgi:hypothetical protein